MILIFDSEATGAQRNHAHPFDNRNVVCNFGFRHDGKTTIWKIQYDDEPYGKALEEIQKLVNGATLLVGFNLKYDLHWLRRYNISIPSSCRIFDCQLAHFILQAQQAPYPSLDGVSAHYGNEAKLDVVKTEYWNNGLDTNEVPYQILEKYLEQDLTVTEQVYHSLLEDLVKSTRAMRKLVSVSMQDLLVLQDIEWNGLLLNKEKSIVKGNKLVEKISGIDSWLRKIFNAEWFNPNSGDHLSVFLYGGTIELDGKETYTFTYKDGRTADKIRNVKIPFNSKGMFKPLEKTELAKEGFYATNEGTLVSLSKTAKGEYKKILEVILQRAKIEKLRSTYYHGLPKKLDEFGWYDNIIHSNFNQCVAQSGRLTSTKPNVQNLANEINEIFISRF